MGRSAASAGMRLALRLLLAGGLLLAQFGAQLQALEHARHDLSLGKGKSLPLGHSPDQCALYHAVDCALTGAASEPPQLTVSATEFRFFLPAAPACRLAAFRSRAPPALS